MVEQMVLKMFSKQTIFSLVDILFKDMFEDSKGLLDPSDSDEEDENDSCKTTSEGHVCPEEEGSSQNLTIAKGSLSSKGSNSQKKEESVQISEEEDEETCLNVGYEDGGDPTRYGVDLEDYLGRKSLLNIERIKDIVGEIMSSCEKNMKYQILEYIMKGVVFDKKILRESFLQEILNACGSATFTTALEKYINDNGMTIQLSERKKAAARGEEIDEAEVIRHERIIQLAAVDINRTLYFSDKKLKEYKKKGTLKKGSLHNSNFLNRLFVMTNQGIQVMKNIPKANRCKTCQP